MGARNSRKITEDSSLAESGREYYYSTVKYCVFRFESVSTHFIQTDFIYRCLRGQGS